MVNTDSVSVELLDKLEGFFCGPCFTSALGDFFSTNVPRLDFVPLDEEQPLNNHTIYEQYVEMVDKEMTNFVAEEGISQEAIFAAAQRQASSSGGTSSLLCLDYIVACTEYEAFMELAYDHKCMQDVGKQGGKWVPVDEPFGELETLFRD